MNVSKSTSVAGDLKEKNIYLLDPLDKIHVREQSAPFAYTDGQEVERRIYEILASARDVSATSPELQAAITDWPTEYHFSPVRHNLLRHLPLRPEHDILEIGAGCGAITRLLGETGASVVAVEGSAARARCARMRCRELANVDVYCTNLQDFHVNSRFDVVTLIGVLEYAPLYISGEDPMLACLNFATHYLKPGGVLVVAIENQLGLKYFCGYPEDHVDVPFFGVQDLYHGRTARTLGKAELLRLFDRAGLRHTELQYPFPDYKLPSVVFFEQAFATPRFRPEEIVRQLRSRDYSGLKREYVPEHLVWPVVGRNDLTRDLSNSFLAFATFAPPNPLAPPADILGIGYTGDRAPGYNTIKRFVVGRDGGITVQRERYETPPPAGLPLAQQLGSERYVDGYHLGAELGRLVAVGDWAEFVTLLKLWIAFLERHAEGEMPEVLERTIAPDFVDCIPQNIIVNEGQFHYIDREWALHDRLMVGTVVLRFLMGLHQDSRARDFMVRQLKPAGDERVLGLILDHLGLRITEPVLENYVRVANTINEIVYPHKPRTRPEDVRPLLSARVLSGGSEGSRGAPRFARAYRGIRRRMALSAHHLRSAIRALVR